MASFRRYTKHELERLCDATQIFFADLANYENADNAKQCWGLTFSSSCSTNSDTVSFVKTCFGGNGAFKSFISHVATYPARAGTTRHQRQGVCEHFLRYVRRSPHQYTTLQLPLLLQDTLRHSPVITTSCRLRCSQLRKTESSQNVTMILRITFLVTCRWSTLVRCVVDGALSSFRSKPIKEEWWL